jgi:uncharacterized membrane protein
MIENSSSFKSKKLLQTELVIGNVLRIGVIICGFVITIGLILTWLNAPALNQFSLDTLPTLLSGQTVSTADVPRSITEFRSALTAFHPSAVIALGLLLLIALPTVRVALTVFIFLFERDYVYLGITLFVLVILLSGIIFGKVL